MSDPRNAAHDRKVNQEKKNHGTEATKSEAEPDTETPAAEDITVPGVTLSPEATAIHEGSLAVLTQVKDMEFHSRANLERLSSLMLTTEDTLKQKDFANTLGELFSMQDALQTKLTEFILAYQAECESV